MNMDQKALIPSVESGPKDQSAEPSTGNVSLATLAIMCALDCAPLYRPLSTLHADNSDGGAWPPSTYVGL